MWENKLVDLKSVTFENVSKEIENDLNILLIQFLNIKKLIGRL